MQRLPGQLADPANVILSLKIISHIAYEKYVPFSDRTKYTHQKK